MYEKFKELLAIISMAFLVGCATIIHGTNQEMAILSNPTAVQVTVDNKLLGKTPIIADLKRKNKHIIKIELEGYLPYEVIISKKASRWLWGNIIVMAPTAIAIAPEAISWGLIFLAVDAITGGLYELTPEQVQAEMRKAEASTLYKDDVLFLTVVLAPDPDWEKIGNLKSSIRN